MNFQSCFRCLVLKETFVINSTSISINSILKFCPSVTQTSAGFHVLHIFLERYFFFNSDVKSKFNFSRYIQYIDWTSGVYTLLRSPLRKGWSCHTAVELAGSDFLIWSRTVFTSLVPVLFWSAAFSPGNLWPHSGANKSFCKYW